MLYAGETSPWPNSFFLGGGICLPWLFMHVGNHQKRSKELQRKFLIEGWSYFNYLARSSDLKTTPPTYKEPPTWKSNAGPAISASGVGARIFCDGGPNINSSTSSVILLKLFSTHHDTKIWAPTPEFGTHFPLKKSVSHPSPLLSLNLLLAWGPEYQIHHFFYSS